MKYVAIEGGCYAGKTTTINHLASEGMAVLPELKMSDGLPPGAVLPPGLEGYKIKIDAWLRAEEKRTEVVDAIRSRTETLVGDRSLVSPIMASHDFGIRYGFGDPSDRLRAFEYGVARLAEAQSAGRIVLPTNVLVMILTDSAEFYRRVEERGPNEVPGDPFLEYEANRLIAERTYIYAEAVWGDSAAKIEVAAHEKQAIGAVALEIIHNIAASEGQLVFPNVMLP